MRRLGLVSVFGAWVLTVAPSSALQPGAAQSLIAKARAALGGELTFTSFKVTGTIKTRNRGESGRFEISCELPWKFEQFEARTFLNPGSTVDDWGAIGASIDHVSARLGFDGDRLIYERNSYPVASWSATPVGREMRRVVDSKAREAFVNLTVGLFASSFPAAPLTFLDAEGPGAARTVIVKGFDFTRPLEFGMDSDLPERFGHVRYVGYRDIAGRKIPTRIIVGTDEWIIKDFKILE